MYGTVTMMYEETFTESDTRSEANTEKQMIPLDWLLFLSLQGKYSVQQSNLGTKIDGFQTMIVDVCSLPSNYLLSASTNLVIHYIKKLYSLKFQREKIAKPLCIPWSSFRKDSQKWELIV